MTDLNEALVYMKLGGSGANYRGKSCSSSEYEAEETHSSHIIYNVTYPDGSRKQFLGDKYIGLSDIQSYGMIRDDYEWSGYASTLVPNVDAHLVRSADKHSGVSTDDRCATMSAVYIPAGATAHLYYDDPVLQFSAFRINPDGTPYNQQINWGRGWENCPVTIDNSISQTPYLLIALARFSDDRVFTDDNAPEKLNVDLFVN